MTGRPSNYSPEVAEVICERLAKGETLRGICRDEGMPAESTVRKWAAEDREGFYAHYARARDVGLDAMADELMDIADDGSNDWMERNADDNRGWVENGEALGRSRLRVDTRKWYLSKLAPKRYGDKLTLGGDAENPLTVLMNDLGAGQSRLPSPEDKAKI